MKRWQRFLYQPVLPLGKDGRLVTGSEEHVRLSRMAATESMVLLKNDKNCLPLSEGSCVALFGKGTIDYVKGGGGSGDVTVAYTRNFYEGMKEKEKEGKVKIFHELCRFYEEDVENQYKKGYVPGMTKEPELPQDLLNKAREFSNTAIITLCRFSGEGWDRQVSKKKNAAMSDCEVEQAKRQAELYPEGDFYLSPEEKLLVQSVCEHFEQVIVVLNTGGIMDTTWLKREEKISAALLAWQGGMEGGLAAADLICGDENPSAKLADTFAASLEDYPSTDGFHESDEYVEYREDIYMGYRYFETIPGAKEKVNYEFGFGLSYTTFEWEVIESKAKEEMIQVKVLVTNTGKRPGKEVLQLYYSAPQGKLFKAAKELGAFVKTRKLEAGESQQITLSFPIVHMASYDDTGLLYKSAWVLEKGEYHFYLGNSIRNVTKLSFVYQEKEDRITRQLSEKVKPLRLHKRLRADGTWEEMTVDETISTEVEPCKFSRLPKDELEGVAPETRFSERYYVFGDKMEQNIILEDVATGKATLDEFMAQLSLEQMICLLGGQPCTGVANTFGIGNHRQFGIPNVMTADGPAGLRILPECGVNTTAWPCATMLACSFNTELVEQIGAAAADECMENNIGIWLAPAVNLHRSPLCGRNFEYYSEDPLVAGKIGAAMVKGVQKRKIAATVKHFACNNKETYRKDSDSVLSERALRELYLKPFEIIVKEAAPWCIMSSYNIVNGVRASENKELLTDILRDEWHFDGMVMSDWWTHGEHFLETKAGNDVKMGNGYPERVMLAYQEGEISEEEIKICVTRVLDMILKLA